MKDLSQIVSNTPKSSIRELFDLAAGRSDVISLGIGQPDFSTPNPAIQGNIDALKSGKTMYAPTRGIPELLQQLKNKMKRENKIDLDWNKNLILANGGSQALMLSFATLFNPGDELVLFSPNFISYFYLSSFFGVKVKEIKRNEDFSPNVNDIKRNISEKTKAILINSPNNPTGYTLKRSELDDIIDLVNEYDLYLISDEVYEKYIYEDLTHISPASLNGLFDRVITINAMSKTFSATGFRLGYVAAKEEIINLMETYLQYTAAGTNHAAQYGFLEAMKIDRAFFKPILESFNERRLLVYNELTKMGFMVPKPRGSFYIMPSTNNFNLSGQEFSKRLMQDYAVAVVPGNIFGSFSNYMFRISYATEKVKLEEAMERIENFISTL